MNDTELIEGCKVKPESGKLWKPYTGSSPAKCMECAIDM